MGRPYVITPAVAGSTAAALIARGVGLSWERASSLVAAAAQGLAAAHDRGVIHGGVRPASIVEDPDGQVFVGDFFAARLGLSTTTANWVAPELRDGAAVVQSDVYGLGATLAGLIIGGSPFDIDIDGRRVSLDMTDHGAPEAIAEVVTIAMARDPEHRQPTASSFRNDLLSAVAANSPSVPEVRAANVYVARSAAAFGGATAAASTRGTTRAKPSAPEPKSDAPVAAETAGAPESSAPQRPGDTPAPDGVANARPDPSKDPAGVPDESKVPSSAAGAAGVMAAEEPKSRSTKRTAPRVKREAAAVAEPATQTASAPNADERSEMGDGSGRSRLALLLVPVLLAGLAWIGFSLIGSAGDDPSPVVTDTSPSTETESPQPDAVAEDEPDTTTTDAVDADPLELEAALTCPSGFVGPVDGVCTQTVDQIDGDVTYSCPGGGELSGNECLLAGEEVFVAGVFNAGYPGQAASPASCPGGYSLSGGICVGSVASATVSACPGSPGLGAVVSVSGEFCTVAPFAGDPGYPGVSATCNGEVTTAPEAECGTLEVGDDVVEIAEETRTSASCPDGFVGPDNGRCTQTVEAS